MRYPLRLPVIFHWNDGAERTAAGFTRDVAVDGAFIAASVFPPVGHDVRIEILFPLPDESCGEVRVECVGTVTRVENGLGYTGFGVRGQFDDDHLTRYASV